MKKVSVIIPVYKKEDTLKRCLESVRKQSLREMEIILIDDGSPDNCGNIIEEYAKKDKRIIAIHQKNRGVSCARNAGLTIAEGEYITFVDADDILLESMLEELYGKAEAYRCQVTVCSSKPASFQDCIIMNRETAIEKMFEDDSFGVNVWGKLYKRELFQTVSFPGDVKLGEDMKVLFDVLSVSKEIVFYRKQLYIQQSSAFNSSNTMKAGEVYKSIEIMEYILERCQKEFPSCVTAAEYGFLKRGVGFFLRLDYSQCKEDQIKTIRIHFRSMLFHKSFLHLPLRYKASIMLIFLSPAFFCSLSGFLRENQRNA